MPGLAMLRQRLNTALRPLGLQVVRGHSDDPAIQPFVPASKAMAAAQREGMSLEDYFDTHTAAPGATAAAVTELLRLANLGDRVNRVCEIGAGSGRYSARVSKALSPDTYEVYETALDWLPHLRGLPDAVIHPADGHTLKSTATASVDLVHAHKVFVYLPMATTIAYLREMARVVRPGGVVAFDIITETCLDEDTTKAWITTGTTVFRMLSRAWTIELLATHGLSLLGQHVSPLEGGKTELLIFRRD